MAGPDSHNTTLPPQIGRFRLLRRLGEAAGAGDDVHHRERFGGEHVAAVGHGGDVPGAGSGSSYLNANFKPGPMRARAGRLHSLHHKEPPLGLDPYSVAGLPEISPGWKDLT